MYLAVGMPRLPAGQGSVRTRARLGRKVTALFGVAGDRDDTDAGAGRAWLTSYSQLTMTELLLGGPQIMKDPPAGVIDTGVFGLSVHGQRAKPLSNSTHISSAGKGEVADSQISPALIKGYGPDQKAAAILTGVNYALSPLTQALIKVLTGFRVPDVRLLMGTTAMLLSEAFRSQPPLILAGVQAARIQRALCLEDEIAILADGPSPSMPWKISRTELPWSQIHRKAVRDKGGKNTHTPSGHGISPPREHQVQPFLLELVHDVWTALIDHDAPVYLEPISTNQNRFEQPADTSQISFIREAALSAAREATERLVFGLGTETGGTRVVLRIRADGTFMVDFPGVATRPARILVDRLVNSHFRDSRCETAYEWNRSPVPDFDPAQWRGETRLTQRVALWAHHCAERFVVSGAWSEDEPHALTFAARTRQRENLVEAAEDLLGRDDPLAAQLRVFCMSYRLEGQRRAMWADRGATDHAFDLGTVVTEFSHAVDNLEALHDKGLVLDSHLVESLQPALTDLRALQDSAGLQLRDKIANLLVRHWSCYVTTQARLMPNGSLAERSADQIFEQLASESAAYDPLLGAILESSPALVLGISGFLQERSLDLAEAIQRSTRLRRELIYDREHDWAPFRQTMIDHIQLLLMRSRCNGKEAQRTELISEVLKTGRRIVDHELDQYKIEHPDELPGDYDPEDRLLLVIAQYLESSAKSGIVDRESGGLKREILYLMARFGACVERRLRSGVWSAELPRQRDVLSHALYSSGFRSRNREHL